MCEKTVDKGILVLRLSMGIGMATHGWAKYANFSQYAQQFPDLLGIGPAGNLALAVFAELICAVFVTFGVFTRLAAIPVIITMATAFFVVHGADPFAKKEMAFLYLTGYLAIFFLGSGAFSLGKKYLADKLPTFSGWKAFLLEQK